MVVASAPGKCILFGEHAVVYGHPAVAVAINARMTVSVREGVDNWSIDGMHYVEAKHPHLTYLHNRLWEGDALAIQVNSEIFGAAGLGSSAALSSAYAAALLELANRDSAIGQLPLIAECAHLAEASAQSGRASPTDSSTSALGGCVLISDVREEDADWQYTRELQVAGETRRWEVHRIDLPATFAEASIVIGFTGRPGPTGEMVAKVADMLESNPDRMEDIDRIGTVTRAGVTALRLGNIEAVGIAMDECHRLLRGIGVSDEGLDRLVEAARPYAYGAKMTGAGGGGCMLALTTDARRCAEAIELAGGRTLISPLGVEGVRIEQS